MKIDALSPCNGTGEEKIANKSDRQFEGGVLDDGMRAEAEATGIKTEMMMLPGSQGGEDDAAVTVKKPAEGLLFIVSQLHRHYASYF